MIYTSYFAKMRKFPDNVFPVAICTLVPGWYLGERYRPLAPSYDDLMQWKCDHHDDDYTKCYKSTILDKLDVHRVVSDLQLLLPDEIRRKMQSAVTVNPDYHIALICYEKPEDFCHRHLVAEWLRSNGYKCEEFKEEVICLQ